MESREFSHIVLAILVLSAVQGFAFVIESDWSMFAVIFAFSAITIIVSIVAKKLTAYSLDADVEHEIWGVQHIGFSKSSKLKQPIPAGFIFPIFFSIFSLGIVKLSSILTYEARALKYRASKRFGPSSYTEMTEWHNALIGAGGVVALIFAAVVFYFVPSSNLEILSKVMLYYAFWNLIPISKLDGAQIFFGSRIMWTVLASVTAVLCFFVLTV